MSEGKGPDVPAKPGEPLPRQPGGLVRITSRLLAVLFRLAGGFRVAGLENIPAQGGAILAGNHLSWADPPAIRAVVRRDCWFMALADLFQVPVIGKLIPMYGAFPVQRGTIDRDALRRAEKHLTDGDLVCVFPEGGTTVTGRLVPFEGGVAFLAVRSNMPLVPFALTGTDRVLPRPDGTRFYLPRWAKGGVTLTFGKPIHPSEVDPSLGRKERVEELTRRLYQAVASLLPSEYLPD